MAKAAKQEETVSLWIGTQADPDDRQVILVSKEDAERIPPRGDESDEAVEVFDMRSQETVMVRRAECNLPGCRCALEFVK